MNIQLKDLRPGDLLLHSSKGEISKLIMWASDSDYSHIAMVFEPNLIAEAISSGVHFDTPLEPRIKDAEDHFYKIDAMRPLGAGDPLPPGALRALQDRGRTLKDAKFALNQLFELGLICAARNKVPPSKVVKWVLSQVIEHMVEVDPARLLCSEFIYLVFHNAVSVPGLDPTIESPDRKNRPFPADLDVLVLLAEYWKARKAGVNLVAAVPASLLEVGGLAEDVVDKKFLAAIAIVRKRLLAAQVGPAQPKPKPDLIQPQDFAESPSFVLLGTVVV
jgi:hypothetical protein